MVRNFVLAVAGTAAYDDGLKIAAEIGQQAKDQSIVQVTSVTAVDHCVVCFQRPFAGKQKVAEKEEN
jgi:hypothetical protein